MTTRTHLNSAAAMRRHLDSLYSEQAAAELAGLLRNETYRTHLEDEITAVQSAYVGTAVTAIAVLRAQLGGRLDG